MTEQDDMGFLARWSKRKAQARPQSAVVETPPEIGVDPGSNFVEAGAAPTQDEVDEIVASLPRIEDLTPSSSIASFLRRGVPLELQRAAMRRIWSVDPAIRDFIEVAENQYDWNAIGGCPGYTPLDPSLDHSAWVKSALDVLTPEPTATAGGAGPQEGSVARQDDASDGKERSGDTHPVAESVSGSEAATDSVAVLLSESTPIDAAAATHDPPPVALRRRHGRALPS